MDTLAKIALQVTIEILPALMVAIVFPVSVMGMLIHATVTPVNVTTVNTLQPATIATNV